MNIYFLLSHHLRYLFVLSFFLSLSSFAVFQLGLNCAVTAGLRVSQSSGADGRARVGSEVWLCRNELNAGIGKGKISILSYSRDRCYHKKVNTPVTSGVVVEAVLLSFFYIYSLFYN